MRKNVIILLLLIPFVFSSSLPYWIKPSDSQFWFKANLTSGDNAFYVYYGGDTSFSNGDEVFDFFDDFVGTSLNSKWYISNHGADGSVSVSNSAVRLRVHSTSGSVNDIKISTYRTFSPPYVMDYKFRIDLYTPGEYGRRGTTKLPLLIDSNNYALEEYNGNFEAAYAYFCVAEGSLNPDFWRKDGGCIISVEDLVNTGWHVASMLVSSQTYYILDGVNKGSASDIVLQTHPLAFQVSGWDTGNDISGYIDWMIIHKFISPSPTITYGSEETGSWTIDGHIYTKRRKIIVTSSQEVNDYQIQLNYSKFNNDKVYITPSIFIFLSYVSPTPSNGTALYQNYIEQNATATVSGSSLQNITLYLYNSSALISSYTCSSSPCYYNFTGLTSGTYYINATAYSTNGLLNSTKTRAIHLASFSLFQWAHKKPVIVNNTQNPNTLIDYQIRIDLNSSNFNFSQANSDGSDIRFTDSDNSTLLSYWIEKWDSSNQKAIIWVKVPFIPASSTKTIYIYYGNPYATSESNASLTFVRVIDGLVGAWDFDEGSGAIAHDSSGNGNNAALHNGPTWVNGKFGKALSFDGSDDYVDVGEDTKNDPLAVQEYATYVVWVNPASYGLQSIIAQRYDASFHARGIFESIDSEMGFWSRDRNGVWHDVRVPYALNTWYHIVGVQDENVIKLYVNGKFNSSLDMGSNVGGHYYSYHTFGKFTNSNYFFHGIIDQIQIYDRPLSSDEILDLYNNYGYTTTNYPGKVLVRKYSSPEPGTTIRSEEVSISTSYVSPTPSNGTALYQNYIEQNATVTLTGGSLSNITLYLYNSSGLISSHTCFSSPCYYNFTGLTPGTYYINATAYSTNGLSNSTETRMITLSYNTVNQIQQDIDGDGILDNATDADGNLTNGYEQYQGSNSTEYQAIDGDEDGKIDHLIDTDGNLTNGPEKYWDPDNNVVSDVTKQNEDNDPTVEYSFDSNGDGMIDVYYDPDEGNVNMRSARCRLCLLMSNKALTPIKLTKLVLDNRTYTLDLTLSSGQRRKVYIYDNWFCTFYGRIVFFHIQLFWQTSGGLSGVERGILAVTPSKS